MPVTTSQPGVYIEELAGLSLSISNSPTAVPVFASGNQKFNDQYSGVSGKQSSKRINSWLEFVTLMKNPSGDPSNKDEFKFDPTDKLHLSMRAYFENGGGYCYIVDTKKLSEVVINLDDVTLLVAAGEDIKDAALALCAPGSGRFAILDGPKEALGKPEDLSSKYDKNAYAAVYYPWLDADWANPKTPKNPDTPTNDATKATKNIIPPSAAVAGAYCTVDRERGVWKAPANIELKGGVQPVSNVSDEEQGNHMEGPAINMIRKFRDTGTIIWGARTLAGQDIWKYIPVRRLFNTAERDIKQAMSVVMFEPNSQPTWERVRAAIDNYLYGIWKQGGLMGNTSKEAYFVKIGLVDGTMKPEDINQGRIIAKVGMAPVRPAEFIILQFTQDMVQG